MSMKKFLILGLCLVCTSCATTGSNQGGTKFSGSAQELYETGNRYARGTGVEKDYVKAVAYYRQAASMGNSDAQDSLGVRV